jgi:hypothetical protein
LTLYLGYWYCDAALIELGYFNTNNLEIEDVIDVDDLKEPSYCLKIGYSVSLAIGTISEKDAKLYELQRPDSNRLYT